MLGEKLNLPYIILIRLIKIHSKPSSSLVYSNLVSKLFEKEGISLSDEIEQIHKRPIYDIY